jgi:uncharacterized membrane protein YdjX (TVP38/TMEM64 family)
MTLKARKWTPLLLLGAVVVALVLANFLDLGTHIAELREWIASLGSAGPLVFVVIYIVAVVAALPGSALSLSGGILFGSVWGVVLVSIGSTIGASLAFLISRYLAREPAARWLAKNERFQKLDRMTEQHGWIIVLLTRLVPIFPFNLLNYGFGLTGVRFRTYVLWSWIGMIPGTIVYTVGGDALSQSLDGKVPWTLVIALAASAVVVAVLVRYARRVLATKESVVTTRSDR